MFTRSGEVTVSISTVREVVLTAAELSRLYSFHHFIFHHVLRLEKLPMTFDPEHAETSNVVVPVNKGDVHFNLSSLEESSASYAYSCCHSEVLSFLDSIHYYPWSRKLHSSSCASSRILQLQ